MTVIFPVIHSIPSPSSLTNKIELEYKIPKIIQSRFFSSGFNDTYQFVTESGVVYYGRIYRINWRTLDDIRYELDMLNHLHDKGVPVAWPICRKNGRFFFAIDTPEGKRYGALFIEASGKELSYKEAPERTAYKYGETVAGMHNALDDFVTEFPRFQLDLDHLIHKPLRLIEPFLKYRSDDWLFIQMISNLVVEKIGALPESVLETGPCHGDLQGFHVSVSDDGIWTFYDFDCGGFGYRAYELAVFRWSARYDDQEAVWWNPYLEGYTHVRPLSPVDINAVPYFVFARYIWHVGIQIENAYEWGYRWLNDTYFDRRIKMLRDAEKDYL